MLLYYVANNTNNYGTDIHKVVSVIVPKEGITNELLEQQYDFVVIEDSLDSSIAGFPSKLVIDNTGSEIIVREKTELEYVEDLKPGKKAQLESIYKSKLEEGCPVSMGFTIDCSEFYQGRFHKKLSLTQLAIDFGQFNSETDTLMIRDKGYGVQNLTWIQYQTMCLELGSHVETLYQTLATLQENVDTVTTQAELDAIVWPS